jgi:two-component system LytT family response regulator
MKKTIRAAIIDDEIKSAKTLRALLESYCPEVEIVYMAHHPEQAIEILNTEQQPDVVFLDIEMPEMNGFQLLERLGKVTFDVIFTTAYDQFALQAFKTNAISYLLKPVDAEELTAAVQKVKNHIKSDTLTRLSYVEEMLTELKKGNQSSRLAVHTSEGVIFLDTEKIIRMEADSNYTHIYVAGNRKITSAKTLKEYEDLLSTKPFFRIHHAHLVNLRHVEKYIKGEGGYVVTSDQTTLEVSRRRKSELLEAFSKI